MSYTLIISEKPSAAKRIAQALAQDDIEEIKSGSVKSYRFRRKDKEIVVVPAVGHLFILAEKKSGKGWTYPVFDVEWKPTYQNGSAMAWSKKYYDNIKTMAKDANEFISSCDYDIEGSTIAYNILKHICKTEKAKRMKFSTLTTSDVVQAYENASDELDFPQIEAGLTRHTMDFFWGINLSRALTLALKSAGGYKVLSTGRVQGPTLAVLDKRQNEIKKFKPTPYWELQLVCTKGKEDITALHEKDKFWEKGEAESILAKCRDSPAIVDSVESKKKLQNPPFPFDLTTMQRESYRCFGYSPKMTLDIAQSLYEMALISYPRTSSQEIPEKIGYRGILKNIRNQKDYFDHADALLKKSHLVPTKGKKKDPAHPAIYPTGNRPKGLNAYQKKIYDLVVKRFFAVFGEPAVRESMKVIIKVKGESFIANGIRTIEQKWMEYYMPYARFKEELLPKMEKGEQLDVKSLEILSKQTQPPGRFTQAGILKEMESLGLGTKATRALILETLYNRGYVEDKQIMVTELGHEIINSLEKHAPDVISVELTRRFDKYMEEIQEGKRNRQEVISQARKALEKVLTEFRKQENDIGKELLAVVKNQQKRETTIGKCKCGGTLVVRTSRKGSRFVGCTGYPKCTETFSLPHFGMMRILKQKCAKCGLYVVSVKSRGRRPWSLCVRCGFVNSKGEPREASSGPNAGAKTSGDSWKKAPKSRPRSSARKTATKK